MKSFFEDALTDQEMKNPFALYTRNEVRELKKYWETKIADVPGYNPQ